MKETKTLNQDQAAALLGVSARRLRQIELEDNTIPRSYDSNGNPRGYPVQGYGRWMHARWAGQISQDDDGKVYDEKLEKARLTHHQANNEALKEQQARGELLPAGLVIEMGAALVAASRAKVLAIHSKCRSRFPGLEQEIADEIEALSREALSELGSDGLPADLRRRIAPAVRRLESAAETPDK
jgi:phage terminase Nu1 subunit (DNA packaging protein)